MDPNVALSMLHHSLEEGDIDTAREVFNALDTWIRSGGFLPVAWDVETKVPQ